jgi:hypothetical protein
MGPWIHGQQGKHAHGQVDFGDEAAIADPLAWRLEWYDHWLKGLENSVGKAAPYATKVRLFTMGTGDGHKTPEGLLYHGGRWRDETEWPPARSKPTPYYFLRNGSMTLAMPTTDKNMTSYVFDPKNPVPTIGGNISSGDGILLQGAWDQRGGPHVWNAPDPLPLSARNDVLVFRTAPLAEDVEVTGEIQVKLWYDPKTLRPLRRLTGVENGKPGLSFDETYDEYSLDPRIPDGPFVLPDLDPTSRRRYAGDGKSMIYLEREAGVVRFVLIADDGVEGETTSDGIILRRGGVTQTIKSTTGLMLIKGNRTVMNAIPEGWDHDLVQEYHGYRAAHPRATIEEWLKAALKERPATPLLNYLKKD